MLQIARAKAEQHSEIGRRIHFRLADMRRYTPLGRFDACLCLFAAFGYLVRSKEAVAALHAMHKQLRPRGLLILDVWNGLAVTSIKPEARQKKVRQGKLIVSRTAMPSLNLLASICTVKYRLDIRTAETSKSFFETHQMKYYYPTEMELLLRLSGFDMVSLHPFLSVGRNLTATDWNMTAVARRTN